MFGCTVPMGIILTLSLKLFRYFLNGHVEELRWPSSDFNYLPLEPQNRNNGELIREQKIATERNIL